MIRHVSLATIIVLLVIGMITALRYMGAML